MKPIIKASIAVTKIDKSLLHKGKDGTLYLNLVFFEKKSEYGSDGYIVMGASKEEKERYEQATGKKMPIIGNFSFWSDNRPPQQNTEYRREETRRPPQGEQQSFSRNNEEAPF